MTPAQFYSLLAAAVIAPQLNEVLAWIVFVLLALFASWLAKVR